MEKTVNSKFGKKNRFNQNTKYMETKTKMKI
jgi:hypothetical protein